MPKSLLHPEWRDLKTGSYIKDFEITETHRIVAIVDKESIGFCIETSNGEHVSLEEGLSSEWKIIHKPSKRHLFLSRFFPRLFTPYDIIVFNAFRTLKDRIYSLETKKTTDTDGIKESLDVVDYAANDMSRDE